MVTDNISQLLDHQTSSWAPMAFEVSRVCVVEKVISIMAQQCTLLDVANLAVLYVAPLHLYLIEQSL